MRRRGLERSAHHDAGLRKRLRGREAVHASDDAARSVIGRGEEVVEGIRRAPDVAAGAAHLKLTVRKPGRARLTHVTDVPIRPSSRQRRLVELIQHAIDVPAVRKEWRKGRAQVYGRDPVGVVKRDSRVSCSVREPVFESAAEREICGEDRRRRERRKRDPPGEDDADNRRRIDTSRGSVGDALVRHEAGL